MESFHGVNKILDSPCVFRVTPRPFVFSYEESTSACFVTLLKAGEKSLTPIGALFLQAWLEFCEKAVTHVSLPSHQSLSLQLVIRKGLDEFAGSKVDNHASAGACFPERHRESFGNTDRAGPSVRS